MKTKFPLRTLIQVAVLIALTIVLTRLLSVSTLNMRIGFSFIPVAFAGMLFGPVWGGVTAGLSDVLGQLIIPSPGGSVNPLITLSAVIGGVIFGLALHREQVKFFPNVVVANLAEKIICTLGLTTLALALMYKLPFFAELVTRLPQFGIMFGIQLIVLPFLPRLRTALRKAKLVDA
ncbi:MAG: folate family ECF transporter S component [Firmicutes bacterium]|nr:folate family ECF transporter S component [Bacillota bacterium]